MAIRAYDEDYLAGAQRILGDAVDFAVMTLELDAGSFGNVLAVSEASKQFAAGNPRYVAGMNGCELTRRLLEETHTAFTDVDDVMYVDKSPEYWAGWALAFYQWFSDRSFMEILSVVPLNRIIRMYSVYHEADIMRFVDYMQSEMESIYPQTKLRRRREACGFSQSELAAESGVPLRQIQLFEQKQRDINKTAAETLLRLSKALGCGMKDLMERSA